MNNETTNQPNAKKNIANFLESVKEMELLNQEQSIRDYVKIFRGNENTEKRRAFIAALFDVEISQVKQHGATVALMECLLIAVFYNASGELQRLGEKVLYSGAEKLAKQRAEQKQGNAITNAFDLIIANSNKLSLEQLYALLNISEGTVNEKEKTTKHN